MNREDGQAGKPALLGQKTAQKIRAVEKEFLRFEGDWRAATCKISRENAVVQSLLSSFAHLERPSHFPVDDLAIGVE
jgi:hypothetical protein